MLIREKWFLGDGQSTFLINFKVVVYPNFQNSFLLINTNDLVINQIASECNYRNLRRGKLCADCRLRLRRAPMMATGFPDELSDGLPVWLGLRMSPPDQTF